MPNVRQEAYTRVNVEPSSEITNSRIPNVRQETYTSRQPDGTLVTTTTKTHTQLFPEREYYFGRGELDTNYCCRPAGVLRVSQIVVGLMIISLLVSVYGPGPFKGILFGQTLLLIFSGIAVCFSFIFLVVFLFELHISHLKFWPWQVTDFMFSLTSCIAFVVLGFIEAYYSTGSWSNNCSDMGSDGFMHNNCRVIYEWVFVSLFCFLNGALYGIGAFLTQRNQF